MFLCVFLCAGDRAPARRAEYVARENGLFHLFCVRGLEFAAIFHTGAWQHAVNVCVRARTCARKADPELIW